MQRGHLGTAVIMTMLVLWLAAEGNSKQKSYPPEVIKVLKASGQNHKQLEKVLSFYASEGDSFKLHAALFLIGNMEGHSYVTYGLYDTLGNEIKFNPLDYSDYDALRSAWDTLETQYGVIDFKKKDMVYDLQTIKADFITQNIDYAFKAWREKPWAKGLSFETFCDYVLAYRGSNEPLENWREFFYQKYQNIEKRMSDPSDAIEAAGLINNDIKSWFSFDPRFYYHPTDQGLSEMLKNKMGRCEDMTNVTIYAMRAGGIPITSDYTPYWANTGNNHMWNAIVTPDGRAIPFMGAEANPGEYHLANKLAKVYRKTFDKQTQNLIFQKRKQEKIPDWLSGKSYKDVTADYEEVCNATVALRQEIPDSIDIAYLCVFNDGEWKPIHWARIENNRAEFTDMGRDILYLPALYINAKIAPFGQPLILHTDCTTQEIFSEAQETITLELTSNVPSKQEFLPDGSAKVLLTSGQEYELFYWKDGWQSVGKQVAKDKPLVFKEVPAGCLYWLVAKGSDKEERIFTVENGKQIWW